MCIAAPGSVIAVHDGYIEVDYGGFVRQAMSAGVSVRPGDQVLVQMGIVIKVLGQAESISTREAWIDTLGHE